MNTFAIIEQKVIADNDEYDSYGITYYNNSTVKSINDITCDKKIIEYIVDIFNTEQPDPIHIIDILENFLIDFEEF